jgi:hypothetical protein
MFEDDRIDRQTMIEAQAQAQPEAGPFGQTSSLPLSVEDQVIVARLSVAAGGSGMPVTESFMQIELHEL